LYNSQDTEKDTIHFINHRIFTLFKCTLSQVCPALGIPFDPFTKLENAVAPVLFGGEEAKKQD